MKQLKDNAYELKNELIHSGWIKRFFIKPQLIKVLDEIDYQEGRLQFANRPYSFPRARRPNHKRNIDSRYDNWANIRKDHFGL